jgi:hypothetical protein
MPASKLLSRTQPVGSAAWRHLDVNDHDIWAVGERFAQKFLGIASLADDVEASFAE